MKLALPRRAAVALACIAALAACGREEDTPQPSPQAAGAPAAEATAAAPDLAACPGREPVDAETRPRREAIPVPAPLHEVMRADRDNIAISTTGGATVCVDASWIDTIDNAALSADGRFASFDWQGYEAFGHVIVDRAGKGAMIDTGVEPAPSPSGRLLAAADLSESGFGALAGFGVWQIEPAGWRELAIDQEIPPAVEWQIERWQGEDCVQLTAIALADLSYPTDVDDPQRLPFRSRRAEGWRLEPGSCPSS